MKPAASSVARNPATEAADIANAARILGWRSATAGVVEKGRQLRVQLRTAQLERRWLSGLPDHDDFRCVHLEAGRRLGRRDDGADDVDDRFRQERRG